MVIKGRPEDLIKIIGHIKNDKAGLTNYKSIDFYYKLMYKYLPSENIVDFIQKLINIPVKVYTDNIEDDSTLLNSDGSLNIAWNNWHINATSQGKLDDVRFNQFRDKCFELSESNMAAADELYRITRTFIIENAIVEKAESLNYIFMNSRANIPYSYRKVALDYVRDSYDILKTPQAFKICNKCGYANNIDGRAIIHRLCIPTYEERTLATGTLILKPEVFNSITNPGRFEYEVYNTLLSEGFNSVIFPEIEREGDILVDIKCSSLYLDMKAYNYSENLYNELIDQNGNLKEKYRNRWIIVPDLYYQEQLEFIGHLLRSNGSRLYNIRDLIDKLKRVAKEGDRK